MTSPWLVQQATAIPTREFALGTHTLTEVKAEAQDADPDRNITLGTPPEGEYDHRTGLWMVGDQPLITLASMATGTRTFTKAQLEGTDEDTDD